MSNATIAIAMQDIADEAHRKHNRGDIGPEYATHRDLMNRAQDLAHVFLVLAGNKDVADRFPEPIARVLREMAP